MHSWDDESQVFEIHQVMVKHLGPVPIAKGDFHYLPKRVQNYIARWTQTCKPRSLYICDGSQHEAEEIIHKLEERGTLHALKKHKNSYICRTDPADVARVESKTWMCTENKYDTVPHVREGVQGTLGQWKDPKDAKVLMDRYIGCMAGRTMYVIPFSMGPVGSPLSKIGVELTDSNYVLLCMRVMARVTHDIWDILGDGDFVRCVHSMGSPRPAQRKTINHWPCNPEKIFIGHFPVERLICSFGSGYGGNSLLGKKCFALRIASNIARDEGWMAEHMLIMGITEEKSGRETYISAAFPSACGKTNLSMITPSIPGFKVLVVGDDIAWMRFDKEGLLYGINPEAGFFGVCPGTNHKTNHNAMAACQENCIFTNVAETADGSYYWEGLEDEVDKGMAITTWLGQNWRIGMPGKAAHPNSRFTAPARQCPIIHPKWEDKKGVNITAFLFGGRRPEGVPLVYESFNWEHGVMIGACVKSESTAAAEHKGKQIMHDPMAMRPFMGYNFGKYLDHWLSLKQAGRQMPKIFHVNWFRLNSEGDFVWPGFGENIRVLDWVIRRTHNDVDATESPIGMLPKEGDLNLDGLDCKFDDLFSVPKTYWADDAAENKKFFRDQVGTDLPDEIKKQLDEQEKRILAMP